MQFNTIVKFGSLAFDVASDDKVRELMGMVHHGARRRGLIGVQQHPVQHPLHMSPPSHWPKSNGPIPFSPGSQLKATPPASNTPKPATQPKAEEQGTGQGFDLKKWVNMDNAKKLMGYAGTFNDLLNK
ncbi:hypothetical protein [Alicyclobacillus dauci]|uniref:Uncharacterized protein n=1 Tax=Alicyclobacillus dauci TaxID=1475485 RepID=A0ABY6YZA4_9BACL|nr:hypothetical protein [Alicyclobacillus dauci]WAH35845.1 hypothetical protein NZD86_16450 [Alicyclobacillus dauci]